MQILPATELHIPQIRQVAYDTWPVTYSRIISEKQMSYMLGWMYSAESLARQMNEQGHKFLVAMEEQQCLGFASYELDYKKPGTTKIHKLYILPQTQGKGVGRKLMDAIATTAIQHDNHTITLNVNRENKAVDFYKRIGFEIIASEDIDIGEGLFMKDFILEVRSERLKIPAHPSH